jgi:hypothetical protein
MLADHDELMWWAGTIALALVMLAARAVFNLLREAALHNYGKA